MSDSAAVARPYARAVFDMARDEDMLAGWSDILALMAALVAVPEMASAIDNPAVERNDILEVMFDLGGDRFNEPARNLLRVLSDNRRLPLPPQIAIQYEALRAEEERLSTAAVVTARPISPAQQDNLRRTLEASLGRRVRLEYTVDKRLIGGAMIRIGDKVIDGSALGRLGGLARELV